MRSYAPCKAILFGEHAVVYNRLGIAAAIDQKTYVEVTEGSGGVEINRILDPKYTKVSKSELFGKLDRFDEIHGSKEFHKLKEFSFVDSLQVVIGETMRRYGYKDVRIDISFDNVLKGVGRSASKYSAITMALANYLGHSISAEEVSRIAYLGDVVSHAGMPSGIDTSAVTFGGIISYRKSEGIKRITLDYSLPLIVVDSGEPARNSHTIPKVKKLLDDRPAYGNGILDEIDGISAAALDSLRSRDLGRVGELMNRNHELLRQLEVSTERLDTIVRIALENGALGAKLTGGGGGGGAVVLVKDTESGQAIRAKLADAGFKAFDARMGIEGVSLR